MILPVTTCEIRTTAHSEYDNSNLNKFHSTVTDFAKFRGQSTYEKNKERRKQYYLLFTSIHYQQLKCPYFFVIVFQ